MRGVVLVQEILVVHIIQRVEFVLGADAAVQRLTVAPLLDVLQSAGDAAVAVGVEGIEGEGCPDIAAGVHLQRVGDGDAPAVHHAGPLVAVGVDEVGACVVGVFGAVDVAVAKGQLCFASSIAVLIFPMVSTSLLGMMKEQLYLGSEPFTLCGSKMWTKDARTLPVMTFVAIK